MEQAAEQARLVLQMLAMIGMLAEIMILELVHHAGIFRRTEFRYLVFGQYPAVDVIMVVLRRGRHRQLRGLVVEHEHIQLVAGIKRHRQAEHVVDHLLHRAVRIQAAHGAGNVHHQPDTQARRIGHALLLEDDAGAFGFLV